MNLLLLLSALLSALTGIGGSVRQPPVAAQAVAQQARVAVAAAVAQRVAARPVQALATRSASAAAPVAAVLALLPVEPAYATRRRE
ncbi:hypothetical protein [Sphingomonas adhaesiva]|uniref:hypothetical protein n=1 Tax=Sphingomonas adhaesiva TaxID=28212 RepID=UPI002FFC48C8